MDKVELDKKIIKYERFLNETLRGDLGKLHNLREKIYEETAEYLQLQNTILKTDENKLNEKPLKTQIDLGCNFFAQAIVDDPSKIFVCVGYGFYVEFTYKEALEFIEKRVSLLNEKSEKYSKEMAHVRAQIKIVMEGLRELQGLD